MGRAVLAAAALLGQVASVIAADPWLPTQWSGRVRTTAHLIDPKEEYPPREGLYHVSYDFSAKRARVVAEMGIQAGFSFFKLYGQKREYAIRTGQYASCKRSYLGEEMPAPELPRLVPLAEADLEDDAAEAAAPLLRKELTHYAHRAGLDSILLVQTRPEDGMAVAVSELYRNVDTQEWDPLMTWSLEGIELEAPAGSTFTVPVAHAACERDLTGNPYLHLFHAMLRV